MLDYLALRGAKISNERWYELSHEAVPGRCSRGRLIVDEILDEFDRKELSGNTEVEVDLRDPGALEVHLDDFVSRLRSPCTCPSSWPYRP